MTGRRDFLYVADCKLATAENMAYLHQRGGGFLSVLPRTRSEDAAFRESLERGQITKRPVYDKTDEDGALLDRYSLCEPAMLSAEGYRLIWFHSTSKADCDFEARQRQVARTTTRLSDLRQNLASPRTRYRQRAKVDEAVAEILQEFGMVHNHDRRAGIRDVSPGRTGAPDGADAVCKAGQDRLRVDVSRRVGAAVGGG